MASGGHREPVVTEQLKAFVTELKRRRVYQAGAVYVVVGAGVLTASELILDPLGLTSARALIVVLTLLGFPLTLVLAWAYELRPEHAQAIDPHASAGTVESAVSPDSDRPFETADQRASIVVLPFDNLSPDADDAYLADGLTDEIITHLTYIGSLRVISRTSAMVLKGARKDVRTIGKELSVQYVLEGSVRRVGNDLRIAAQLIDARSDAHLWAEVFKGTLHDIFAIQERTSQGIVKALGLRINPQEEQRLLGRPIDNVQAYECYLRARSEALKGSAQAFERALLTTSLQERSFDDQFNSKARCEKSLQCLPRE
jgi:adenylate cyclase